MFMINNPENLEILLILIQTVLAAYGFGNPKNSYGSRPAFFISISLISRGTSDALNLR